jgi:carbonic anhydrase
VKATVSLVLALILVSPVLAMAATTSEGTSAQDALKQLMDGNARYVQGQPERSDQRPSAAPQHPIAAILSCSDSRVPPELIFDRGVGSLFIVRAAGNTCDRLGVQSLEYAVAHLGTRLIVVMGHDQCGAVDAALKTYPKRDVGPMLENIYPAVRAAKSGSGDAFSNAIDENAMLVAKRLEQEPAFASAIKSGKLKIVAARYALDTGKVKILSPQ